MRKTVQVELAQLEYLSTRLIRGGLTFERQKGGDWFAGPGETQLETDRRLLKGRIKPFMVAWKRCASSVSRTKGAGALRGSHGFACWVHQRREIDPVQSIDGIGGLRGGSAVCHAGSDPEAFGGA